MKKLFLTIGLTTLIALSACSGNAQTTTNEDPAGAQEQVNDVSENEQVEDNDTSEVEETDDDVSDETEETDDDVSDETEDVSDDADESTQDENEESTKEDQDKYDSYLDEMDSVYYTLDELKAVFYIGMDYTTYLDEITGEFEILETFVDENSDDSLDVFMANDGFLGVLYTPDEGIKNIIRFKDMHEAAAYLN